MGKADDILHIASDGERVYQVISMDYTHLTKAKENGSAVLVVHDDDAHSLMAFAVPPKGACITLAQRVAQWVGGFRHSKIIIKINQEPAIAELMKTSREQLIKALEEVSAHVRAILGIEDAKEQSIAPEHLPVGESTSNGTIENVIERVQG